MKQILKEYGYVIFIFAMLFFISLFLLLFGYLIDMGNGVRYKFMN